jgi:diguanylate cyclase (GGDEF)-like protein/PAS domain S-box-containing protein
LDPTARARSSHEPSGRQEKPFWVRPIYLILVLAVLIGSSAFAITSLQNRSADQYRTAVETDELAISAYHMFTAAWRATISNQAPAPYMDAAAAAFEADTSMQLLTDSIKTYDAELAEGHLSNVRDEIISFGEYPKQTLILLQAGRVDEALTVMAAANDVYYPLSTRVNQSALSYAQGAERTRRLTLLASVAILASLFALGALLYWRYRATERRAARAAAQHEILQRSEARFRPLVQSSSDLITVIDRDGVIQYASPAIEQFSGRPASEVLGTSILQMVATEDQYGLHGLFSGVAERPGYTASAELHLRSPSESAGQRSIQVVCTNRLNDPDVNGLVLNVRDISERKALEEQLRHQAFHDSLTGLANRLRFMDRLDHALQRGKRNGGKPVSVLYMDLDYFKNVNDEMGHSVGDDLLKQVAKRIRLCLRNTDTAARLGGDEFAILLEEHHTSEEASSIAERLLEQMRQPFHLTGREVSISASIGVVVADPHSMTPEEIIRNADVAMYDAKENGRGRIQVFEPSMQLSLIERLSLSSDLSASLELNELKVYYQPILHLDNQRIAGLEALVRWQHPTRGLLLPVEFIELAEESGFIQQLGTYVLHEACRQGSEWQTRYPALADVTMSVNVSAHQLQKPGFVSLVQEVLADTGFNPNSLILEITESVLIRHPQDVIPTLESLKKLGVHLALDDFGTGYSSLSYLKRFPIDILKIDRSFVDGMNDTDRDRMLVQTVIDLGHTLKLDIVAEGIERSDQLKSLQMLDCALGQGYLFAKALGAGAAEVMLREQAAGQPLPSMELGSSRDEVNAA